METKVRDSICSKIRSKTCNPHCLSLKPNPKEIWRSNWTILVQNLGWTLCVYEHNPMMRSLSKNNNNVLIVIDPGDHNFNHSIIILKHQYQKKEEKREAIMSFQIYLLCFCLSFHVWPTNLPNNVDLEFNFP